MTTNGHVIPNKGATAMQQDWRFDVVILGAGAAGSAVAETLSQSSYTGKVAIVEPSTFVYDQPEWLRVATGSEKKERTRRHVRVPAGVTWIKSRAERIDPEHDRVHIERESSITYGHLILATGVEVRWNRIRGLDDVATTDRVCSVYGYEQAEHAWDVIHGFHGGRAIFTAPSSPYKGGKAPYTILKDATEVWRDQDVLSSTEVVFATAWNDAFHGGEEADPTINGAKSVRILSGYDLVEVRPDRQEAVFNVDKGNSQSQDVLRYALLHIAPPMRPPAVVEESVLAYPVGPMHGFLEVNAESLRHPRYRSVYGVGDVLGVQMVKTGERARRQAAQVVRAICGTDS